MASKAKAAAVDDRETEADEAEMQELYELTTMVSTIDRV
jgi:hypothetical protein